jgi:hypothetical protein
VDALGSAVGYRLDMLTFESRSSLPNRKRSLVALGISALCLGVLAAPGCGDEAPEEGSRGSQATGSGGSGGSEATGSGGAGGAGAGGGSCIDQGHVAGERFPAGDDCNFCDCQADGTAVCSDRACKGKLPGCTYAGQDHAYAERFPATDGCNECVCAASGLACTRRPCTTSEEGAILVESLDTPCGPDAAFTAKAVLDGLPVDDLEAPYLYEKSGALYPETLPDTAASRCVEFPQPGRRRSTSR